MDVVKDIGAYLRTHQEGATRYHIEQSLADIFRMMFNLDLATAQNPFQEETGSLSAYVFLTYEGTTACVSIRILRTTALLIAERAGVEVSSALAPFVLEDVAGEIINIVSHNLRKFLAETTGALFTLGETFINKAMPEGVHPDLALTLDFEVKPQALISINFLCSDHAKG